MSDRSESTLSVDEFVEYCRMQAGLLSGHIETMGTEADGLLDEIDEGTAEIRRRLDGQPDDIEGTATPQSAGGPDGRTVDIAAIEQLEKDLERKQALVEAKRVRMQAFQRLAGNYTDLAEELRSSVDDGQEAMNRVVRFETDHDAPAYFEDRQTVYEAAATSDSDSE